MILNQLIGNTLNLTCNTYHCKNIMTISENALGCQILSQRCKCGANFLKVSIFLIKFLDKTY